MKSMQMRMKRASMFVNVNFLGLLRKFECM